MDRVLQIDIVTQLMNALRDEAIKRINAGDVPTDWDGIELRQYLADRAADQFPIRKMERARLKKYRNDVLTLNL